MGRQNTNVPKRRRRRLVALGDLNEKIDIQTRTLRSQFESGDNTADEVFVTVASPWSCIETIRGQNFFDNIEQGLNPTHAFYIRFRPLTSQEFWIWYRGVRYDILDVENMDERSEFLKLSCRATGTQYIISQGTTDNEGAWG